MKISKKIACLVSLAIMVFNSSVVKAKVVARGSAKLRPLPKRMVATNKLRAKNPAATSRNTRKVIPPKVRVRVIRPPKARVVRSTQLRVVKTRVVRNSRVKIIRAPKVRNFKPKLVTSRSTRLTNNTVPVNSVNNGARNVENLASGMSTPLPLPAKASTKKSTFSKKNLESSRAASASSATTSPSFDSPRSYESYASFKPVNTEENKKSEPKPQEKSERAKEWEKIWKDQEESLKRAKEAKEKREREEKEKRDREEAERKKREESRNKSSGTYDNSWGEWFENFMKNNRREDPKNSNNGYPNNSGRKEQAGSAWEEARNRGNNKNANNASGNQSYHNNYDYSKESAETSRRVAQEKNQKIDSHYVLINKLCKEFGKPEIGSRSYIERINEASTKKNIMNQLNIVYKKAMIKYHPDKYHDKSEGQNIIIAYQSISSYLQGGGYSS